MASGGDPDTDSRSKPQTNHPIPPDHSGGPVGLSARVNHISVGGQQRALSGMTKSISHTIDSIAIGVSPEIWDDFADEISSDKCNFLISYRWATSNLWSIFEKFIDRPKDKSAECGQPYEDRRQTTRESSTVCDVRIFVTSRLLKRSEEQREKDRQRLQKIDAMLKRQQDVEAQHEAKMIHGGSENWTLSTSWSFSKNSTRRKKLGVLKRSNPFWLRSSWKTCAYPVRAIFGSATVLTEYYSAIEHLSATGKCPVAKKCTGAEQDF